MVAALKRQLRGSEALVKGGSPFLGERLRFTRLSFDIIEAYTAMVTAAASEVDYAAAVRHGERAEGARLDLAGMNAIFTVGVLGSGAETAGGGAAWLAGEVQQYRKLAELTAGN